MSLDDILGGMFRQTGIDVPDDGTPVNPQLVIDRLTRKALAPAVARPSNIPPQDTSAPATVPMPRSRPSSAPTRGSASSFGDDDEIVDRKTGSDFGADDQVVEPQAPAPTMQENAAGLGEGFNARTKAMGGEPTAPPPATSLPPPIGESPPTPPEPVPLPTPRPDVGPNPNTSMAPQVLDDGSVPAPAPPKRSILSHVAEAAAQAVPGVGPLVTLNRALEGSELAKGFKGTIVGGNLKNVGDAAQGLGHIADSPSLVDTGKHIAETGKAKQEGYEARVPSYTGIRTDSVGNFLEDVGSYSGYMTGQGLASSAPSLGAGLAVGALTRNPVVGIIAGAALPSYVQNFGDVYGSAKDDKDIAARIAKGELTEKQVALIAAIAAVPMAALDVMPEAMFAKNVLKEAKEGLIKRVIMGVLKGGVAEGSTEGLQEIISQWTQHYLGSQTPMRQKFDAVVDNVLGGMFPGMVMGGGSAAAGRHGHAAPAQAPNAAEGEVLPPEAPGAPPPGAPPPAGPTIEGTATEVLPPDRGLPAQPAAPPTPEPQGAPASAPSAPSANGPDLTNQRPPQEVSPPVRVPNADRALLQAYGYDSAQIDGMSEVERGAELEAARDAGVQPGPLTDVNTPGGVSISPTSQSGEKIDTATFGADDRTVGTRAAAVDLKTSADVDLATAAINEDHSHPQGEANNIQRGHAKWDGFPVTFEARAGGKRRGIAPDGTKWDQSFTHAYGYFRNTEGADGDKVDVYFGPNVEGAREAYVLNENDRNTGKFRQSKTFVGFNTEDEVRQAYLGSQGKTEDQIAGVAAMPVDEFKDWLRTGNHKKPVKVAKALGQPNPKTEAKRQPLSVTQYLASRGGLRPDGDLRALGLGPKSSVVIPGVGPRSVMRAGGMSMDEAAEALFEGGYLPPESERAPGDYNLHNRIRGMVDDELRGQPSFAMGEEMAGADRQSARSQETADQRVADARDGVHAALTDFGIEGALPEDVNRAAEIMLREGLDPADAYDQAIQIAIRDEHLLTDEQIDALDIRDDFDALGTSQETGGGERAPAQRENGPSSAEAAAPAEGRGADEIVPHPGRAEFGEGDAIAGEQRAEGEGHDATAGAAEGDGRAEVVGSPSANSSVFPKSPAELKPITEPTPAGDQTVLPGAEKISTAEQAQRKADEPLKPKAAQKPMDAGMFGDEDKQLDLVDQARQPAEPEKIVGAAVRGKDGRIFTGPVHSAASANAADFYKVFDPYAAGLLDDAGLDGFLTSTGRYVDRHEALRIADRANQEGEYDRSSGELRAEQLYNLPSDERAKAKSLFEQENAPADNKLPDGFKITTRARQVKGGGTEERFALYRDGKYLGVYPTRDEAVAAAASNPDNTSDTEEADGLQGAVPAVDARASAADVQESQRQRGVGKARERAGDGSGEAAAGHDRGGDQGKQRQPAGTPAKGSRALGEGAHDRVPPAKPVGGSVASQARETGPSDSMDRPLDAAEAAESVVKPAPGLYSAVQRTVETVKLAKAPAAQWLNTIRNAPGVKAEEMQWLGLDDWLKEQKGAVTKDQVLGYIAANKIEVQETAFGDNIKTMDRIAKDLGYGGWRSSLTEAQQAEVNAAYDAQGARAGVKFQEYTLPGGENYREMLLTLPQQKGSEFDPAKVRIERKRPSTTQGSTVLYYDDKWIGTFGDDPELNAQTGHYEQKPLSFYVEVMRKRFGGDPSLGIKPQDDGANFRSSHWDEPNVLAHVRFNDRVIDGKKTLFIEEIQSDWHQAGKKKGYRGDVDPSAFTDPKREPDGQGDVWSFEVAGRGRLLGYGDTEQAARAQLAEVMNKSGLKVPDAPFKTTWPELSFKRVLRYAAQHGYEKIAWTPGEVQAERYTLSKQVSEVRFQRSGSSGFTPHDEIKGYDSGTLIARDHSGKTVIDRYVKVQDLPDYVGKDVAEKLLAQEPKRGASSGIATATQSLSGLDLKVGGEGMLGFYDDILPATVNKLVKKYGARVKTRTDLADNGRSREEINRDMDADLDELGRLEPDIDWSDVKAGEAAWRRHPELHARHGALQEEYNAMMAREDGSALKSAHVLDITPALRDAAAVHGFPMFSVQKPSVGETQRSGFYFQVGRKLAEVPDALFKQGGQAVLNWLTQAGVKRAEIEHFQLQDKFGNRNPTTREAFEQAITERMFDFRRKVSAVNPERSRGNYDLGGTRAFDGPRIPGRGTYFERLLSFPKKLQGGEQFAPGQFESPHWYHVFKNAWASWRGSVRDVPGWGKMVVGEEGQSDYMQGPTSRTEQGEVRRPRIEGKKFFELRAERKQYEEVMRQASSLAFTASYFRDDLMEPGHRQFFKSYLVPSESGQERAPELWNKTADNLRDYILAPPAKPLKGEYEARYFKNEQERATKALDDLIALRKANEKYFAPGAIKQYAKTESSFTPETPLDQSYVRSMVRDLILHAAKEKADSIAISTTTTTGRIQNSDRASHFYDQQLKPALERELRRLADDPSIALTKIALPKALGAPKSERPYTVWATKLTPALRSAVVANGLPMLSVRPSLAPAAQQRQADLEHMLSGIVERLVGPRAQVRFEQGASLDENPDAKSWGQYAEGKGVLGMYTGAERLIELALGASNPVTNAYHEAFHDIEAHLLAPREVDLMVHETPRLRSIVKARYGFTDAEMSGIVGYEVRAMAFEAYAAEREEGGNGAGFGLHIGVRLIFERLLNLLRSIRNGLAGMGFHTAEDIFGKAYQGEFSTRPDKMDEVRLRRAASVQRPTAPAFKRWFGESKVVDASGEPLVVYHGTTSAFDAFDPAALGRSTRHPSSRLGFYFSADPSVADLFTQAVDQTVWPPKMVPRTGANLMPVYLSIKNPFTLTVEQFREINARPYGEEFEAEQPEAAKRTRDWVDKNKALLLKQGYDGIHIKGDKAYAERLGGEEYSADAWVAFKPEQIKSATGNRGTFDETMPSVVQSVAKPPQLPLQPTVSPAPEIISERLAERNLPKLASISRALGFGKLNTVEARTQLQDKFIRVKKVEEAAERATSRPVPESMSAYLAESLYYGRTGQRLEALDTGKIDPLIEDIKERGLTLEGLDEFLMARHAPERNRVVGKINPAIASPAGMTDAEAKAIIDKIDASGKRADYDAIETRVRNIIEDTEQTQLASGLITQETAIARKATYKNYVPLRGFAEGSEDEATIGQYGSGFDVRGEESKRALGRSSKADGPLAYVLLQAQQAIVRSEKAKVGKAALRFFQHNPNPDLWTIDTIPKQRGIDPKTGMVTEVTDPSWYFSPNVFGVKVGGEVHRITFHGEDGVKLARAFKNLGSANLHSALRLIATLTRITARLATSLNPDFLMANFARDAGEAFTNLQAQEQKAFVRKFAKHILPAIGGSFNALRGAKGGKYAEAFREFDKAGGRIRFFGMEDVDDIKANVASKLRRLEGGVVNNARALGEKAVGAIEIANGSIENATRLAAFMAGREVGMTPARAASLARELTVNFNRKGELGSVISSLYMFANAAMQGTTRMATALQHKRVRRFAYGLAATGALLAIYNLGAGGDDDDGVPMYLKIPSWERDSNLIVMWPQGVGKKGSHSKIPLPYGYAFFHTIGARLMLLARGKDKAGSALGAILGSVLESFDPLGRDQNIVAHFLPTLVRPGVHIATNESWTGRPINPKAYPTDRRPASSRYFESASDFSVGLAQRVNEWTGGRTAGPRGPRSDPGKPGAVDLSPGSIDHMLEFIGGGLGRFVKNSITTGSNLYHGEEWDVGKTPIVRRFYGAKNDAADAQLYYETRESARSEGNDRGFQTADRNLTKLRAALSNVRADKSIEPQDRKQRMIDIRKQMLAIQNSTRSGYTAPPK